MTITCEVCGTANPDGTTYCEGCGVELTTKAAAPAPATPESAPAVPAAPLDSASTAPVEGTATPAPAPTDAPTVPDSATEAATDAAHTPIPAEPAPADGAESAPSPAPSAEVAPPAAPPEAPVAADSTTAEHQQPAAVVAPTTTEAAPATAGGPAKLGIKKYGAATGEFIPLAGERLVVGRFDASTGPVDIDLTGLGGQEHISRRHAELYLEGGTWKVRDLGSTNGVYIKRQGEAAFSPRLTEPAALSDGDEIAFGNLMLSFHQG